MVGKKICSISGTKQGVMVQYGYSEYLFSHRCNHEQQVKETLMFCMTCGTQLPDTAQFCYSCGAKITPQVSSTQQEQPKKSIDDLLKDEQFLEFVAKGVVQQEDTANQEAVETFIKYAKKGPVDTKVVEEAVKLLEKASKYQNDPLKSRTAQQVVQALQVFQDAETFRSFLQHRWYTDGRYSEGKNYGVQTVADLQAFARNGLPGLLSIASLNNAQRTRIMGSPGIVRWLEETELIEIHFNLFLMRKFDDIDAMQATFDQRFGQQKVDHAHKLAEQFALDLLDQMEQAKKQQGQQ
jgi:hypothetical protein